MPLNLADSLQGAFKLAVQLLGHKADAEDVFQDAITLSLQHASAPTSNSNEFAPWFYKVVRNKAIDRLRQIKRQTAEEFDEQQVTENITQSADLEQHYLLEEYQQVIQQALANLSLEHREIILLRDYHQWSYADITHILDIPAGTVMSHLHRARLALKAEMQKLIEQQRSKYENL